jgi:hypothetical protein
MTTTETKTTDLEKLLPEREITIAGEAITVRPFFFGQLPKAVKLLRPIAEALRETGIASLDGNSLALAPDWALRLPQLFEDAGEPLVEFVAFAVGKPRAWFDTLAADEGVKLTRAVFEANASFFVEKIAPLVGMQPVAVATETGAPSSPDSYLPATPGKLFGDTP